MKILTLSYTNFRSNSALVAELGKQMFLNQLAPIQSSASDTDAYTQLTVNFGISLYKMAVGFRVIGEWKS